MALNMMCFPSIQKNVDNMMIGDSMFIDVFQQKLNYTPILPCMFCYQLWFKKQATHLTRTMYMNYLPYIPSLLNVNPKNIIGLIICNNCKRYLHGKDFPKFLVPTIFKKKIHSPFVSILFELKEIFIILRQAFA
jgi:hypothetical protein